MAQLESHKAKTTKEMIVTKMIVSTLLLKIVTNKSYVYRNIAINEIKSRENLKGLLEVIDISEKRPRTELKHT